MSNRQFATTHWSVVFAAARAADDGGRRALETLCEQYWYPLYAYVRRQGHSADEASDLTQAFFVYFLDKHVVRCASPARGRLRSFLLTCLQNFLRNEMDRRRALKRGGGMTLVSFEGAGAEERYRLEPADREDPEQLFNRRWALSIIERALRTLRLEFTRRGKAATFDRLQPLMTADSAAERYRSAGDALGMTPGAVRVAVHRMRRQFRDLLRAEVSQTVDTEDTDEEVRDLLDALGPPRGHP